MPKSNPDVFHAPKILNYWTQMSFIHQTSCFLFFKAKFKKELPKILQTKKSKLEEFLSFIESIKWKKHNFIADFVARENAYCKRKRSVKWQEKLIEAISRASTGGDESGILSRDSQKQNFLLRRNFFGFNFTGIIFWGGRDKRGSESLDSNLVTGKWLEIIWSE